MRTFREKPKVTVGILNYFRLKPLKVCINSLYESTRIPFKLHIVNQGYLDDDLVEYYSSLERRPNVQITYLNENIGMIPGRKFLAEHLNTRYLFISDDDLCFTDGWLTPLVEKMDEDPLVGAISPIYYEMGKTLRYYSADLEECNDELLIRNFSLSTLRRRAKDGFAEVDHALDGCVLIRGDVFDEVTFDENYYIGNNLDFFMQMKKSGYRSLIYLNSKIKHKIVLLPLIKRLRYESIRLSQDRLDEAKEYFKKKWDFRKVTRKPEERKSLKEKIKHLIHRSLLTFIFRLSLSPSIS